MSDVSIHPDSTGRFIDRLHEAFLDGDAAAAMKPDEAGNVARLQEQYRALARGDIGAALALMAEEVEMELTTPADLPIAGAWRGRDEVWAATLRNFGSLADQSADLLTVVAQGDTVMLLAEERGRVRATGVVYHVRWAQLYTFRGDKVVRIRGLAAQVPAQPG